MCGGDDGDTDGDGGEFDDDDVLVFGAERAGLTDEAKSAIFAERMLTIPMRPGNRSINLANAVSIVVYEAWRQRGFAGAGPNDDGLTSETLLTGDFDS